MSELERLVDDDGAIGAAFRAAESDAPPPEARAALLGALSLGAGTAATTSTIGAATTLKTVGQGAAAKAGASLFGAWKIAAISALVVSGTALSVHVATKDEGAVPALAISGGVPSGPTTNARSTAPTHPLAPGPASAPLAESVPRDVHLEVAPPAAVPAELGAPSRHGTPDLTATSNVAAAEAAREEPSSPSPAAAKSAHEEPSPSPAAAKAAHEEPSPSPAAAKAAHEEPSPSPAAAPAPPAARVAEELALLDAAKSALAAGRPSEALATLRVYDTTFARPVLHEEALALRVEALARAGRATEAERIGRPFLEARPSSPVAIRIRRALEAR